MRVFFAGLIVAAIAVALPQIASAQRPGGGAPGQRPSNPIVAALDADGDGTISKDELANAVAALKKLDKNGDGVLSGEEIRPAFGGFGGGPGGAGGGEQFVTRLLESDKDKDGKLSKEEVPERMKETFDRADTNKDGFLDKAELTAMASRFGGGRPGGGAPGARPGARAEGGARPEGAAPARPEAEKKP